MSSEPSSAMSSQPCAVNVAGTAISRDVAPLAEALPLEVRQAQEARLRAAWRIPTGWRYWSAVNNTVVGLWYVVVTLIFFLFGGVLALLMRLQLAAPGNDVLSADAYNQVFTLHGSVMMFLFAIPIFEAVSILFLPQMIGARELPFPRLSAFGFWAFAIGGTFLCGSIFFDAAPRGGWFMYPPLTSRYQPDLGADIWLLGFSFIEVAAIAAAVELIVGVLRCRPPGMRLNLIPLYAWYVLVAAFMVLFAFPPLIAGTILLELERAFGWPFFDPAGGGDPLLWQHLFWIFGHPEVYIIFLPSIALVAMIVPTAARRPIVGYSWVVLSAIGTGFLSFGLWVHHMFTTGLPGLTLAIFSAASMAVAIPTGVQFFCFLATLLAGRIARSVPMLYVIGGLSTFVIGGLTGVMVALAPFNLQAHDTFFVVAHLHTVLIGGAVFPLLAALYYYFPLVNGKRLSDRLGRISFWFVFAGFNLTFMPMHALGMLGMPRRVFTYPAGLGLETLNVVATIGAFVLAIGIAIVIWDVVRPKGERDESARNPWESGSLEWLQEMPGESWGMRCVPEIDGRYPLWDQPDLVRHYDEGRFYLPDAEEGRREMLMTTSVDATPVQCMRIPGPSFMTPTAAVFVGGMFIFPTYKLYGWMLASTVLAIVAIVVWLWTGTNEMPEKETKDVGLGLRLPLYVSGRESAGWWAMCITMLAVFTAFLSLVFGYFFFWTRHADFVPASKAPGVLWPAVAAALLLAAWWLTLLAMRANRRERAAGVYSGLIGAAGLAAAGVGALIAGPWTTGLVPSAGVYAASVWLLVIWTAVHVAVGVLMHGYCLARRAAGRMTARYDMDIVNVTLYWHFTAATVAVTVAVIAGFPLVA
jgi:cytochrome c oxidase subunit I+III